MISFDDYRKVIKRVLLLTGQSPNDEQLEAIYEEIKDYEMIDFAKACKDDEFLADWSKRINYPALKRTIEKYMFERLEREEKERKRKEREELYRAIKDDQLPEVIKNFLMKIKTL